MSIFILSLRSQSITLAEKGLNNYLGKIGKALSRGGSNLKSLAKTVLSHNKLRETIEEQLCNELSEQAKTLCSSKTPSILRTPEKETLKKFSWELIGKELKEKAPLLYQVLLSVAVPNTSRATDKKTTQRLPGVCLAVGVLLKVREPSMSFIPYMMSLVLRAAGTSKKV